MEKLRVSEVVIVEGRYDATAVAGVLDGLILTTDGFGVFSDAEKRALIRRLGAQRGLLILTDSDAAGFKIRHYVEKIAKGSRILHAYIPALPGKERRKKAPSKEGTLGVEGLAPVQLRTALEQAGVCAAAPDEHRAALTPADLYAAGLSGTAGSAQRRRALLARLGLPPRLSTKALCQVLGSLYGRKEVQRMATETHAEKPVLFWDFHGTLTHPDINWFDAAMEAAAEAAPEFALSREVLTRHFGGTCLPWFSVPSRDTRHLVPPGAWWAFCEAQFEAMFRRCGCTPAQAQKIAPMLRQKILQPHRYRLYADAPPTLRELARRGYQSHILSNNFPELEQVIEALGIRPCFGQVLVSGAIGYEKPRPEIFAAARRLAKPGQAVWMIGDNPQDDIAGAAAQGFVTVATHNIPAPGAAHTIGDLGELLDLLR